MIFLTKKYPALVDAADSNPISSQILVRNRARTICTILLVLIASYLKSSILGRVESGWIPPLYLVLVYKTLARKCKHLIQCKVHT